MHSVDVNVLLYACFTDSPDHDSATACLNHCRRSDGGLALQSLVASSFLRLATDSRLYESPLTPEQAVGFLSALVDAPGGRIVQPGPGHWVRFAALVKEHHTRRGDVTDAWLAAAALDARATWYSYDRGFARFRGLRWIDPRSLD